MTTTASANPNADAAGRRGRRWIPASTRTEVKRVDEARSGRRRRATGLMPRLTACRDSPRTYPGRRLPDRAGGTRSRAGCRASVTSSTARMEGLRLSAVLDHPFAQRVSSLNRETSTTAPRSGDLRCGLEERTLAGSARRQIPQFPLRIGRAPCRELFAAPADPPPKPPMGGGLLPAHVYSFADVRPCPISSYCLVGILPDPPAKRAFVTWKVRLAPRFRIRNMTRINGPA